MKMHAVVNLGSELGMFSASLGRFNVMTHVDLSLVNFVVEKWHAPQFASVTGISD